MKFGKYEFGAIEKKWQKLWQENPYFKAEQDSTKPKYYCLDMFPYPSASGLHVGHWKGYVFSDIFARKKWLEGYNVLHPMGWDAFGLPAENDAIKKGLPPKSNTATNIANFKRQLARIGAIYDWSREVNTTDPNYYHWTQWIFLKMFKAGLAYQEQVPVNWCPQCLTGLANEEATGGQCDRCGTAIEQKPLRQWVLKITEFADALYDDLDELNWPEKVKLMQKHWIGRSHGLVFRAPVKDTDLYIETFSAHFESFFADTFVVIASDHPLLPSLVAGLPNAAELLQQAETMTSQRKKWETDKASEGFFTGRYIIDPVGNGELPIWVASFAIKDYGTGIVKCSAHDQRDFAFAKKYGIRLKPVLFPTDSALAQQVANLEICYDDMVNGILQEPKEFAGRKAGDCRQEIIDYCVKNGLARVKTSYKLRDWIFSRQRYWGEPIPLVHCQKCGTVAVPEEQLPIQLPEVERYQPTGTGESPLADIANWVNTTCPQCAGPAKRETNTMPQWAGSCWYFLRYIDPTNNNNFASKEAMNYWMPVDLYVGGVEHAVLHLLYARFYIKFLHSQGYLSFKEPFKCLFNQGMVCMRSPVSGRVEKMSKSKGNVVDPDEIVNQLGSDTLRMYMLFMGPPELDCEWQDASIRGVHNFLQRLWSWLTTMSQHADFDKEASIEAQRRFHRFLKIFTQRVEENKVNTVVSATMEFFNDMTAQNWLLNRTLLTQFLTALSIMVPHFSSQLLEQLLDTQLSEQSWPQYDATLAEEHQIQIVVQINGKLKGSFSISKEQATQELVEAQALQLAQGWLQNRQIVKTIVVAGRLVNFVVKQ